MSASLISIPTSIIVVETKILKFSFLNFSSTPMLALFSSQLICFSMIFATDYDSVILNIAPFCLILGVFLLCLSILGVLYKILIASIQKEKTVSFCNHQIIVCIVLVLTILLFGLLPDIIFNQIATSVEIGNY